jgi:hypothetical protein
LTIDEVPTISIAAVANVMAVIMGSALDLLPNCVFIISGMQYYS